MHVPACQWKEGEGWSQWLPEMAWTHLHCGCWGWLLPAEPAASVAEIQGSKREREINVWLTENRRTHENACNWQRTTVTESFCFTGKILNLYSTYIVRLGGVPSIWAALPQHLVQPLTQSILLCCATTPCLSHARACVNTVNQTTSVPEERKQPKCILPNSYV